MPRDPKAIPTLPSADVSTSSIHGGDRLWQHTHSVASGLSAPLARPGSSSRGSSVPPYPTVDRTGPAWSSCGARSRVALVPCQRLNPPELTSSERPDSVCRNVHEIDVALHILSNNVGNSPSLGTNSGMPPAVQMLAVWLLERSLSFPFAPVRPVFPFGWPDHPAPR